MTNYTNVIMKYLLGELTPTEKEHFEIELKYNEQLQIEYQLQLKLDHYMKSRLLFEDVQNDPLYELADTQSKDDIQQYLNKINQSGNKKAKSTLEERLAQQIQSAEIELALNGLDNEVTKWTKDWGSRRKRSHQTVDGYQIVSYIQSFKPVDKKRKKKLFQAKFLSILGGSLVTILVVVMIYSDTYRPVLNEQQLFDKYYKPLTESAFVQRGNNTSGSVSFGEAIALYQSGMYDEAKQAMDQLPASELERPEGVLFYGLNQMARGDYYEASKYFNSLLSNSEHFQPEAKWYLALCYLKTGEILKTREFLEDLISKGYYTQGAQDILKYL